MGRRFCRQQYRGCEELDFASKRKMSKSEILVYPLVLKLQKHTWKIKLTHPKELYALRSRFDVRLLLFLLHCFYLRSSSFSQSILEELRRWHRQVERTLSHRCRCPNCFINSMSKLRCYFVTATRSETSICLWNWSTHCLIKKNYTENKAKKHYGRYKSNHFLLFPPKNNLR